MNNTKLLKCILASYILIACPMNAQKVDKNKLIAEKTAKLESSPLYGEKYQSLTFDGGWNNNSMLSAFRYNGKFDRVYSVWVDCYGDLMIGYYDNKSSKRATYTILDNKKINLNNSEVAFSIDDNGGMRVYLLDNSIKNKSSIMLFVSDNENIGSWKQYSLNVSKPVYNICAISMNNVNYLATVNADGIDICSTNNDKLTKLSSLKKSSANDIFKLQSVNDKLYLVADNNIYSFTNNSLLKDESRSLKPFSDVKDIAVTPNGVMSVNYSDNTITINNINNGKAKSAVINNMIEVSDVVIDADDYKNIYITNKINHIYEVSHIAEVKSNKWAVKSLTQNTPFNNKNIIAIHNTPSNTKAQILWMQESLKDIKVNRLSSVKMNVFQQNVKNIYSPEDIKLSMQKVADWQLGRSYIDKQKNDWQWGAFWVGMKEAYKTLGDQRYFNEMMNVGQYYEWGFLPDVLHADRLLACDLYTFLYNETGKKDKSMIAPTKLVMDLHSSRKSKIDTRFALSSYRGEWWTWCDALFMAPMSFFNYSMVTGDETARDFAFNQWCTIEDYLYSKPDSLFYRDDNHFVKKSTNGMKVFWGRGNGWVMGAMPQIMNNLPEGNEYREHYIKLFQEMSSRIKSLQMKEGLWPCSLLDPKELYQGESSGSAFFGYAIAWGINNGILDKKEYEGCLKRAWEAINKNVSSFGRLGYVQQIADRPYPFYANQYHTYASGAYLLFANEMLKFVSNK